MDSNADYREACEREREEERARRREYEESLCLDAETGWWHVRGDTAPA